MAASSTSQLAAVQTPVSRAVLRDASASEAALAELVGADTVVLCADGRPRRYVNLDYAASTPALVEVWHAVERFLPWYSSVHRGSGRWPRSSAPSTRSASATAASAHTP